MAHPEEYELYAGIETRFHGPTNTKSSRISARRCDHRRGERIVWTDWNGCLSSLENYVRAALHFLKDYEIVHPLGLVAISTQRGIVFYLDWKAKLSETQDGSKEVDQVSNSIISQL